MYYQYNLGQRLLNLMLNTNDKEIFEDATCSISRNKFISSAFFLADHFKKCGLVQHQRIAIYNDKSHLGYLIMLACNIMGLAYSNIDPKLPKKKKENILNILNPIKSFDLFDCDCRAEIENISKPDHNFLPKLNDFKNIVDEIESSTICYIMFTSGSTGAPKGVAVSHHSVLNFIDWSRNEFNIHSNSRLSGINQIYFDNSVFDFYCSIYNGACLVAVDSDRLKNSMKTVKFLSEKKITHWFSVPSYLNYCVRMKSLKDTRLDSMLHLIFGGEAYPKPLLKKVYDVFAHRTQFYNVYGPTETTCMCSSYKISKKDFLTLNDLCPIGKIAKNFGWTIEDVNQNGVGELILQGPQVANGYLNDEVKTLELFSFWDTENGVSKKTYKTGDLVRADSQGNIVFIGRKDFQIKHMGYRIELEEIELGLLKHFKFIEVCVVYKENKIELNGKIIAFVVTEEAELDSSRLNAFMLSLPIYMRPHEFKLLDKLPKTRNGKIDRMHLLENI